MTGIRARALAALALLAVGAPGWALGAEAATHQLDHIGFAMADLDEAVRVVSARTGIEPVYGGEHPNASTYNALLSLGEGRYLEILAVRPDSDADDAWTGWLRGLESLTGVLWAVRSDDVEESRRLLAEAGFETTEPQPGSRRTPQGRTLSWHTFGLSETEIPGAPFFIQWSEGVTHPSSDSPAGCTLVALTITTPAAADLARLTGALGVADVRIEKGDAASIGAELDCPKGRVSF